MIGLHSTDHWLTLANIMFCLPSSQVYKWLSLVEVNVWTRENGKHRVFEIPRAKLFLHWKYQMALNVIIIQRKRTQSRV
jgi:hypothetical protein